MINTYTIGKNYSLKVLKMNTDGFSNYTYVITDVQTNKIIIIDPAWEIKKLTDIIECNGLSVEAILLTHSHYDHVNLVEELVSKYNCNVYMSALEVEYYNYQCTNLKTIQKNSLECFDTEISVIATPGHTLGSVCFLINKCLFTGDTLFIESCGICNTVGGSYYDMYHSLMLLYQSIEDDIRIFPGHKYRREIGEQFGIVKNNYIFKFKNEDIFTKCRKAMDKQATINQLLKKDEKTNNFI